LTISSIGPSIVSTTGGTICSLTVVDGGTSGAIVTDDGLTATVISQSPTLILFKTLAHTAGPVTISATNGGGTPATITLTYSSPYISSYLYIKDQYVSSNNIINALNGTNVNGGNNYNVLWPIVQLTAIAGAGGTVIPLITIDSSSHAFHDSAYPGFHYGFSKWSSRGGFVRFIDSTQAFVLCSLSFSDTIDAQFVKADSLLSCYPKNTRIDNATSAANRLVTFRFYKPVPEPITANTILHYGIVSLGKSASNTDSTVTDTVPKYPVLLSGYYRIFATDVSWKNAASDTVLNGSRLLNPSGTVTNP
jgi:hypothetical protein